MQLGQKYNLLVLQQVEHVGILKRSKMGCGQGCFLSPMFNFQRDHHGKQMTTQKRFPDLTERTAEIEQGLIQTYTDTSKIHHIPRYTFTLLQQALLLNLGNCQLHCQFIGGKQYKIEFNYSRETGLSVQIRG